MTVANSIVIVNPTSYTGYGYTTIIKKFFPEYSIIGLWTDSVTKDGAKNAAMHLIDRHFIAETPEATVELLKEWNPSCFLVGNNAAFTLADYLQRTFFPDYSNDHDKAIHRVNKYSYLKYLFENNIINTEQFILDSQNIDRCRTGEWVLKPCYEHENNKVYIKPNYTTVKRLLESKITYIAQQYIEGQEYCIEICSYSGVHRCTIGSVIKGAYLIDSTHPWYEENELVSSDDPNVKIIYNHVVDVLNALGIKLGLTWTKVKINNGIPSLISINFTGQDYGAIGPIYNATGYNWAVESLRAYLKMYTVHPLMYNKIGNFNKIIVNNHTERLIERMYWPRVEDLPGVSYCEKRNVYEKHCAVTTDNNSVLGVIVVQNNDPTLYQLTVGAIREWKKNFL